MPTFSVESRGKIEEPDGAAGFKEFPPGQKGQPASGSIDSMSPDRAEVKRPGNEKRRLNSPEGPRPGSGLAAREYGRSASVQR